MKVKVILLCFICSITHISCKAQINSQIVPADSVVVSTCPVYIYPLTSDKNIEKIKHCGFPGYRRFVICGLLGKSNKKI